MGLKMKLATASGAALLAVAAGSAHAVKGAGSCTAAGIKAYGSYYKVLLSAAAKYCVKAPDPALAAKMGGKLESKLNRKAERLNKRLTKLDCATNADPDYPVPIVPTPVFMPGDGAAFLAGHDEDCNGIDDNP